MRTMRLVRVGGRGYIRRGWLEESDDAVGSGQCGEAVSAGRSFGRGVVGREFGGCAGSVSGNHGGQRVGKKHAAASNGGADTGRRGAGCYQWNRLRGAERQGADAVST